MPVAIPFTARPPVGSPSVVVSVSGVDGEVGEIVRVGVSLTFGSDSRIARRRLLRDVTNLGSVAGCNLPRLLALPLLECLLAQDRCREVED